MRYGDRVEWTSVFALARTLERKTSPSLSARASERKRARMGGEEGWIKRGDWNAHGDRMCGNKRWKTAEARYNFVRKSSAPTYIPGARSWRQQQRRRRRFSSTTTTTTTIATETTTTLTTAITARCARARVHNQTPSW